ncbi:MAG: TM2 domain-containing protein [Hyphomicrobiales bacterium]
MKNRETTAILALFFGGLGVHRFYLNQPALGVFYLLFCWTLIPSFLGLIDFIVFLSMSRKMFDLKYNLMMNMRSDMSPVIVPIHCANCNTKLTFMTTPNFGEGKLSDGGRLCRECLLKIVRIDADFGMNSKKQYDTLKIKELLSKPKVVKESTPISSTKTLNLQQGDVTLKSILAPINKPEDIKKLERESDRYSDKYADSNYKNAKYKKLSKLYEEAFRQACDIVFYYQFVPDLDLDTPKHIMDFAFKTVEKSEYSIKRRKVGGTDREWNEITGDDLYDSKLSEVVEEPPFYYDSLLKFRQIVESDISFEEKKNSINDLAKSDRSFFDEFFERDTKESAGEQWIKIFFRSFGIPLVDRLYDLGYDSPMKFMETDIESFKDINGLGPQKIEQLQVAIQKMKKNISC